MNTEKARINITLPKDLIRTIDSFSGPRKRSHFIAEAVALKLRHDRQLELDRQLAEGYRACKKESIEIASEFEPIDLEGWDDKF